MQQNLLKGTNKAKFFNDFIKQYPPRKLGFILILYLCYFWHSSNVYTLDTHHCHDKFFKPIVRSKVLV